MSGGDRFASLQKAQTVLVSACLLGEPCRYDGTHARCERVLAAVEGKRVIPICPEVAGGLVVPRAPAELRGGDGSAVLDGVAKVCIRETGADVTEAFLSGARMAMEEGVRAGATAAVLKQLSPSCGASRVYVDGALEDGQGVTAAALRRAGLHLVSDDEAKARGRHGR